MNDSFLPPKHWYISENTILNQEKQEFDNKSTPQFPAVFINNKLVRGNIDKVNLFDEICKAMKSPKA